MKLIVNKDYQRGLIDFYIFQPEHRSNIFIYFNEGGTLQNMSINFDESFTKPEIKPILSLPFFIAEAFITLIAEYAKNEGISVKEQSNLQGQVNAKDEHIKFIQENFTKLINHITKIK